MFSLQTTLLLGVFIGTYNTSEWFYMNPGVMFKLESKNWGRKKKDFWSSFQVLIVSGYKLLFKYFSRFVKVNI